MVAPVKSFKEGLLRGLREDSYGDIGQRIGHSPHRPELAQQRPSQHQDPLWIMSFKMALEERKIGFCEISSMPDLREAFKGIWSVPETLSEVQEVWRSLDDENKDRLALCIGKAISIERDRRQRLKALGNSVVSDCGQFVAEKILGGDK